MEILKKIQDLKPGESALSLEFYDRSAQYVLDEYLMDFIDYDTFIEEIDHPPPNHKDYRLDHGGLELDGGKGVFGWVHWSLKNYILLSS